MQISTPLLTQLLNINQSNLNMEKKDLELIAKLKTKDTHLANLWDKHLAIDHKIEKLENSSMNIVNNTELTELKKQKLLGRDEIEKILAKHRK